MISPIKTYKDLIFWQKAYIVARKVFALCRKLPNDQISMIMSKQIIRSATSIGANVAEGYGRYKGKEYERFLQIALGSAQETDYWLLLLKDEYMNLSTEINSIDDNNQEVIRMLIKTLGSLRSTNH